MLKKSKRGEMHISFGMLFSIILIIAFIAFAFYAIKTFLGVQGTAQLAKFRENLQEDVDELWRASRGSQKMPYSLPKKVEQVCFQKGNYENLIFLPIESAEGLSPKSIEHIDIDIITLRENPYCIDVVNGKFELVLKKDFGEELVTITRA